MKTEQKKYHDAKREPANFKIGDLVLVRRPDPLLQRIGGKLAPTVCGPFPIIDIIVPNTTYKVDVHDSIISGNKSFHASKPISYRFLADGMDNIPTQDTIPIHFTNFQPNTISSSQPQLDNNCQPLSPQLRNNNDSNLQETINVTNSTQPNSLRAELYFPQITVSSENTNSDEAQQGSPTDVIDDEPYDNTIEASHPTSPTTTTEPKDQLLQMQKRNKSITF